MPATRPRAEPSPEVVRYFREKKLKPSFSWKDVWGEEHAHAFTVAKSTGFDILGDVRQAVDDAISNGETFEMFQAKLEPALRAKGWWGTRIVIDPKTGEKVRARLGSGRRLKIIYEANLRTARAAGQWERAQRTKAALPFFEYSLGPSERHRPHHVAKKGLILAIDDPFWDEWYPPNGWGCKCWLRQIGRAEAAKNGGPGEAPDVPLRNYVNSRTGEVTKIPEGIDPGWQTSPGKARARGLTDRINERLQVEGEANARDAISELWSNGTALALAQAGERIRIPAGVSREMRDAMGAKSGLVTVSSDTIRKKAGKHLTVAIETFRHIQDVLDSGEHTGIDALGRYGVWKQIDGLLHKLGVKLSDRGYLYVSTFFESGPRKLRREKEKR